MRTIDITTSVSAELLQRAQKNLRLAFNGHVGTHFDVINKEFPLEYLDLDAIVFEVAEYAEKEEIGKDDIDLSMVKEGMFVAFHTGFIEQEGYATKRYFSNHPQLSIDLIHVLLDRHVCIIGVDFAGVRRGKEHMPTDKICADHGTFIVENLCNLSEVLDGKKQAFCKIGTYPVKFKGQTGLPCRVIARAWK